MAVIIRIEPRSFRFRELIGNVVDVIISLLLIVQLLNSLLILALFPEWQYLAEPLSDQHWLRPEWFWF